MGDLKVRQLGKCLYCPTWLFITMLMVAVLLTRTPLILVGMHRMENGLALKWGDVQRFLRQAEDLSIGKGFLTDDGIGETRLPPGYPIYLAALRLVNLSPQSMLIMHLALAIATVILLYMAGRQTSERIGRLIAIAYTVAPAPTFWSALLMSETFAAFITAACVFCIATARGSTKWHMYCWAGVSCTYAILTSPATLFLQGIVLSILLVETTKTVHRFAALLLGVALIMIPWQVHCYRSEGRVMWTVYKFDYPKIASTGFGRWVRTWLVYPSQLHAAYWDNHFNRWKPEPWMLTDQPTNPSENEPACGQALIHRQVLRRNGYMIDAYRKDYFAANRVQIAQADEYFSRIADARVRQHPLMCQVVLPFIRCITVWTSWREMWLKEREYIGRLSPYQFVSDYYSAGLHEALVRTVKGFVCTCGWLLNAAYAVGFVVLALRALLSRDVMAWGIVIGVALYTVSGAIMAWHEIRRNVPFYPWLLYLACFACRSNDGSVRQR